MSHQLGIISVMKADHLEPFAYRLLAIRASLVLGVLFFGFVVWTELSPTGSAMGGASMMCGRAVGSYRDALEMYQEEHQGKLPATLDELVPKILLQHPECFGTFNGCRPLTRFRIVSTIRTLMGPRPSPPQRPHYRRFVKANGKQEFELVCPKESPSTGSLFECLGLWENRLGLSKKNAKRLRSWSLRLLVLLALPPLVLLSFIVNEVLTAPYESFEEAYQKDGWISLRRLDAEARGFLFAHYGGRRRKRSCIGGRSPHPLAGLGELP